MGVLKRWSKLVAMLAILVLAVGTAKSAAAAQATTAKDVVLAWIDALNAHDEARLRALSDPAMLLESSDDPEVKVTYDDFFATLHEDVENELHWDVVSVVETAADTVVVDAALTSHDIPVLPHGFIVNFTFMVSNGKVIHAMDKLPEGTLAELAALEAGIGMPSTGSGDNNLMLDLLMVGALILAGGLMLKFSRAARN